MAVSLETVDEVIKRTLGVLDHKVTTGHALRVQADTLRTALRRFVESRRLVHPENEWLSCEVCEVLNDAAKLLSSGGYEGHSEQIQNMLLADALFGIAKQSHYQGCRHDTRAEEIRALSDEIRYAASRLSVMLALEPVNCPDSRARQAGFRDKMRERVSGTRTKVIQLQNLIVSDPHCDETNFGPVFARATSWIGDFAPKRQHHPVNL